MLQIPIQPVPSQQVLCVLGGQNCQIAIYRKGDSLYADLNSNGANICLACLAHNGVPLDSRNSYDGFQGNLYFIDTQGSDDPLYTGLGSRWVLVYLTAAEVALTEQLPVQSFGVFTLAAVLSVTSIAGGNFSVAHGLSTTPLLIEIVPTAPGAIWAQSNFADATNINLVASDAGVSALIYVYTFSPSGLDYIIPWGRLLAVSPGAGAFSLAHGLGSVPSLIEVLPTSNSPVWAQVPAFDGTNVYLEALEAGATAIVSVFPGINGSVKILAPSKILNVTSDVDGNFSVAHTLTSGMPSRIQILMLSGGVIWAQTPAFDSTFLYLVASDIGITAKILIFA